MKQFELRALDYLYYPPSLKRKRKNRSKKQHEETRKLKKEFRQTEGFKGSLKEFARMNGYEDWFMRKQIG